MATYSKLLLSTGGGIISQIQQAEQVEHTCDASDRSWRNRYRLPDRDQKAVRERSPAG